MTSYRAGMVILLLMLHTLAFAKDSQTFVVRNNDTILAVIAEKELSRLVFKNDNIKSVFVSSGEMYYEVVDQNLYIKPNVLRPVNFFVRTEKDNTYKVILTSKDIPSVQIFVINNESCTVYRNRLFTGEGLYREVISEAISVSLAGDETLGYEKKVIDKQVKGPAGISMQLDSKWIKDKVTASKYYLRNDIKQKIALQRSNYLDDFAQAVYIDKDSINPGESAILITVRVRR